MMKVFMDRGEKTDEGGGIICVAATIFKPTPYKRFVRAWDRMLAGWGASAFHATDFYPGGGEFKRNTPERQARHVRDSRTIPAMIGARVERIVAVAFLPDEFHRLASDRWKAAYGTSPHAAAVQISMNWIGHWAKEHGFRGGFAYFMESGDPDEAEVSERVSAMRRSALGQFLQIHSFSLVDKGTARGLETADFMAWHWNKYYMDKVRRGQAGNARKDLAALVASSKEKVDVAFIEGARLKMFLMSGEKYLNDVAV